MYKSFIKRVLDFIFALIALILLSPLILVLTLWLHFANKGAGAFFTQERPGKDEKNFKLYKFKSMTDERDRNGILLPDDQRITKVGRFVRKTSLDELPQLWNVLKGDMSFIGPRPLLVEYLPLYNEKQRKRHEIRPGITGWAQVNGRNAISWEEKFDLDIWYVKNISFIIDCSIFLRTIKKVLKKEGISSQTSETMEKFRG
ncbi:Putative colanic biosynthesis UDP-glucose lipid carrier transferase [Porphyromonas macacae]|uniref:Colanic biosynthesis UDP-glucose lipid carrier transferase n=1 Tax=Porphyromonas macacae TaxID=28115 RepID=A0A379E6T6_9PORP|nr:sugar transferase [Porphyromonas macacae]SUB88423.1 Putative colanic biosynthesis UDP-glucose lipid carrier transferase [Porphyromonas macacae]